MNLKLKSFIKYLTLKYHNFNFLYPVYIWATGRDWTEATNWYRAKGAKIGTNTRIHPRADMMDPHLVTIGNNCSLSVCVLITHDMLHHTHPQRRPTGKKFERITIGNNVLIGYNVLIYPGVTIGDGAIVSAGSIVKKDLNRDSIFKPS